MNFIPFNIEKIEFVFILKNIPTENVVECLCHNTK